MGVISHPTCGKEVIILSYGKGEGSKVQRVWKGVSC